MPNSPVTEDNHASFDIEPEGTKAPITQAEPPAFLLTADKTEAVRFQPAKPGYAYDQVEYFVDQVKSTLRFLEQKIHEQEVDKAEKIEEILDLQETITSLKATIEVFRATGDPVTATDGSYVTESQLAASERTEALTAQVTFLEAELAVAKSNETQAIEAERILREYVDVTLLPWLTTQTTQPEQVSEPEQIEEPTNTVETENIPATTNQITPTIVDLPTEQDKDTPTEPETINTPTVEQAKPETNQVVENVSTTTPVTESLPERNNKTQAEEGYNLTLAEETKLSPEVKSSIAQQTLLSSELENATGDDVEENPILKEEPNETQTEISANQKPEPKPEEVPDEEYSARILAALAAAEEKEAAPVEATPVEATPVEATPVEATPVEATPVEAPPVDTTPVEATPIEATPVEATPVDTTPVEATENSDFKDEEADNQVKEKPQPNIVQVQPKVVELPLPKIPPTDPTAKTPFGKAPEEPFEMEQNNLPNPAAGKPAFNRLAASPEVANLGQDIAIAETEPTRADKTSKKSTAAAGSPLPKLLALSPEALAAQQANSMEE